MNVALFRQILRRSRIRMAAAAVGALIWGFLAPVVFASVIQQFAKTAPSTFTHFGSGDIATLSGSITVFYEHPFIIAILATVAVGMSVPAIAGACQRGTLEMMLARPISRHAFVITTAMAIAAMLGLVLAILVASTVTGALLEGYASEVPLSSMPLVWFNALLLYSAFAAFGVAASASNNRSAPAMGLTVGYLLVNYLVEVLAPLWQPLQPYQSLSLIHHFQPGATFSGSVGYLDMAILTAAVVIPLAYTLVMFPRRDLAASG